MADIKGITIEIDGNVGPLSKALSSVNSDLKSTQSTLRALDKALKLDPSNLDLLQKKQKSLQDAVEDTKQKLDLEREALAQLKAQDDGSEEMAKKQKELEREITTTEAALVGYESELGNTESAIGDLTGESEDAESASQDLGEAVEEAGDAAESSGGGWTATKQILVDFAETAVKAAVQAVKELAGAMKDAVVDSAAYADEIMTLSTQTHLSTDTLQEFQYMSELVDVDLETVTGSLTKLTKNMSSAASGSGAAADAFNTLGVSATDSNGELRSSEEVFYELIDSLGNVENETERDALAMSLFGKSAKELNPLIDAGTDTIKSFADEAHEVGYVLDGETLDSLGAVDDSFQRMQATLTATRNNIVAQMAPALADGGGQLLAFAQSVDWESVGQVIGRVVSTIVSYIPVIISTVQNVVGYVQENVIPVIQSIWANVEPVVSEVVSFISESMPAISEAVTGAMEIIGGIVQEVWPLISTVISNALNTIKDVINIVLAVIHGDFSAVWSGIQKLVTDKVRGVWNIIKTVFNTVKGFVTGVWNGIKTAIQTPINAARTAVSTAIAGIRTAIASVKGSAIIQTFQNIKTRITSAINTAKDKVKSAIEKIKSFFDFSWELPRLKLPHFSLTGSFSLAPPSVPKLSVEWYKKAYENGVLFQSPTVIPTASGLKGFGDGAGAEIVLGLDRLKELAGTDNRVVPMLAQLTNMVGNMSNRPIYLNSRELTRALKDMGVMIS